MSATTIDEYLEALSDEQRAVVNKVRQVFRDNVQPGFEEGLQYGAPSYFVPHSLFPAGYHCDPKQPVPFIAIAARKGGYSLHLFCLYVDNPAQQKFVAEWKATGKKLDIGASCVRFKNLDGFCEEPVANLLRSVTVEKFLAHYTHNIPVKKTK